MSWSFSCLGKPSKVAEAIDKHSETLNGQSKVEFDDAKPHLMALVNENFAKQGTGYSEPTIDFEASGSGSFDVTKQEHVQRNCTVSIKPVWKTLV